VPEPYAGKLASTVLRGRKLPGCLILKKKTVLQIKDKNMMDKKANSSAKSKEVQHHPQADAQLHHICFCPNARLNNVK